MKLFFREYGRGEPLIIVHGLFGMSDNWISVAKKLAVDFKVYLPDMRNHGKSPHSSVHTYDAMSDDLFEFIEDMKIKKATFIGHSMGGKTVLQFAEKHFERVKKIIVLDISPVKYIPTREFFKNALNHKLLLEKFKKINLETFKTRAELSEFLIARLKDPFLVQLILKNIIKENKTFFWKINIDVLYKHLDEMRSEIKLSEKTQNIETLFIFGGNSPYFRKEDETILKNHFAKIDLKFIPDAGHLLHIEKEQQLINELNRFLLI